MTDGETGRKPNSDMPRFGRQVTRLPARPEIGPVRFNQNRDFAALRSHTAFPWTDDFVAPDIQSRKGEATKIEL